MDVNKRPTKKSNKKDTFNKYGKHTTRGLRIKTSTAGDNKNKHTLPTYIPDK